MNPETKDAYGPTEPVNKFLLGRFYDVALKHREYNAKSFTNPARLRLLAMVTFAHYQDCINSGLQIDADKIIEQLRRDSSGTS